ncbi:MAG: chromate transporter [Lachnospiraceae bacterium]|nr:chromate transporter [Lachnospiraceae bacterium]
MKDTKTKREDAPSGGDGKSILADGAGCRENGPGWKWKTLVGSMLKIGLVGFGGGNALVPLIEKSIVGRELVSQDDFDEDVVIANITPGALPVELASGVGKRVLGRRGMLAAALAMAVPGVFLTILLLILVSSVGERILLQVQYLTVGITAGIACLLTDYVAGTRKEHESSRTRWASRCIILIVFALTCGKNLIKIFGLEVSTPVCLSTVDVFVIAFFVIFYTNCRPTLVNCSVSLLFCILYLLNDTLGDQIFPGNMELCIYLGMIALALYGLKKNFTQEQKVRKIPFRDIGKDFTILVGLLAVALVLALSVTDSGFAFVKNGTISSLMSFGGGDAYLTVADALFVNEKMISSDQFYSLLVPITNILPGSILCKMLSGVGYLLGYTSTGSVAGGVVSGVAGFLVSVAASCGVFAMIGDIYRCFHDVAVFRNIKKWIRPIVAGLMLTVISSLVYQNCKVGLEMGNEYAPVLFMGIIYALMMVLKKKRGIKTGAMFLLAAVLSFALCNIFIL